jgi:hypothetical protein
VAGLVFRTNPTSVDKGSECCDSYPHVPSLQRVDLESNQLRNDVNDIAIINQIRFSQAREMLHQVRHSQIPL